MIKLNPVKESGAPLLPKNPQNEEESLIRELRNLRTSAILPSPQQATVPLNEYNTVNLCSMAFLTLFPTGRGDLLGTCPYRNKRTFVQKYRALLKYCESESNDSNVFEYRFAKHSRFVLWLYNLHYRHRTLSQGKIYIRQCPTDANTPITELQSLIDRPVFENPVLQNMQRYMANIPGTPSYWYRCSQDLSALISYSGTVTFFFTLTLADFHDPHLHRFIGIPLGADTAVIKQYLNDNPHRANWYFTKMFEIFLKTYFINFKFPCFIFIFFHWRNVRI